jgi:hypothetical protein
VNEAGGAEITQDCRRPARLIDPIGGDAGVERLPRTHDLVEGPHGLLEWGLGIGPVVVVDVDIVHPQTAQALIETGHQILARAPVPVRPRPHLPARLCRDHHLVAVRGQVSPYDTSQIALRRPGGRPVVVGQVKVRDPQIEGAVNQRPGGVVAVDAAKVVPQPQRQGGQLQTAAPAPVVLHVLVSRLGCPCRSHGLSPSECSQILA